MHHLLTLYAHKAFRARKLRQFSGSGKYIFDHLPPSASTCSAARLDSCAGLLFSAKLMLFHCALLAVKVLVVLSLLLKLEPNNRNNAQLLWSVLWKLLFRLLLAGFPLSLEAPWSTLSP